MVSFHIGEVMKVVRKIQVIVVEAFLEDCSLVVQAVLFVAHISYSILFLSRNERMICEAARNLHTFIPFEEIRILFDPNNVAIPS